MPLNNIIEDELIAASVMQRRVMGSMIYTGVERREKPKTKQLTDMH